MRHFPHRHITALAVLAALVAGAPRAAAAPQLVRTLPNKATLIVRENRTRPVVSLQVWVQAGTRNESRTERGASAVLAQLPWEGSGTQTKIEFDEGIQMVGGRYWGEAAAGHVLFEIEAPARTFEDVATTLGRVVTKPKFDPQSIENAKATARVTARNNLGHAALASITPLAAALHPGSPLGAPRTVSETEIEALTLPLVRRFYDTWVVGGNVMIVVAGDVDPEAAERIVTRAFADLPNKRAPRADRAKERPLGGTKVIGATNPPGAGGASITIGFRAPAWGTADALALDALASMLVDYGDARIQRRLGEGPFLGASAQRSFEPDGGTIAFTIAAPPENLKDAEGILFGEIARARFAPIGEEEFRRTIETIVARDVVAQSDFAGVGRVTAITAMQGNVGGDEVHAARLHALRPEDLVAVARQYLDPKEAVVVAMAPKNFVDSLGLYDDLEPRVLENLKLANAPYDAGGPHATASEEKDRRRRVDAPLASIPKEPRDAGRGFVTRSTVAGGIRLLTSEDHGPGLVTVAVYLEGSVRHENEKNNGITRLLRETLLTTTDPKSEGRAYRFSLLDLGRLAPYQDRDMWGYSLTVPADRWKDALGRLGAMLAHPELDSVSVDATRLHVLDEQARWLQDDAAQREQLIFKTKYQVSGYRFPLLGSRLSLLSITPGDLQRFHEKFVVRPNLVVAVFGDVSAGDVAPAVSEAFRDVRSGAFEPGEVVQEGPFEGFREEWELGEGAECTVSIAYNGPPANSPDVPVLYVINSLFTNPKGWLKTFVRDKAPAVVGTESYVAHMIDESPIVSTVTVDGPLQEEHAVKMLFGQFRSTAGIKLVGEFDRDYDNARHHAAWTYQMSLGTSAGKAFQCARAEVFRLPSDYVAAFPARLLAVTPDDIQAAAFRYFQYPDAGKRPYAVCETRPGGW